VILTKDINFIPATLNLDLNNTPDIAQTIVVTCLGLGVGCHLTGLHTLKLKRQIAEAIELTNLGASITVTNDSLTLEPSNSINSNIKIATYNDHRECLVAPLALKVNNYADANVVSKSYQIFGRI
jgi:3-phosphoshikimate 1-carboxyvinyltransferase